MVESPCDARPFVPVLRFPRTLARSCAPSSPPCRRTSMTLFELCFEPRPCTLLTMQYDQSVFSARCMDPCVTNILLLSRHLVRELVDTSPLALSQCRFVGSFRLALHVLREHFRLYRPSCRSRRYPGRHCMGGGAGRVLRGASRASRTWSGRLDIVGRRAHRSIVIPSLYYARSAEAARFLSLSRSAGMSDVRMVMVRNEVITFNVIVTAYSNLKAHRAGIMRNRHPKDSLRDDGTDDRQRKPDMYDDEPRAIHAPSVYRRDV